MFYYLSNSQIPNKKAHAIQQMKMCQAFATTGAETHFVYPRAIRSSSASFDDLVDFYGLGERFEVTGVPSLTGYFESIPQVPYFSKAGAVASWVLAQVMRGRIGASDVIYGRGYYAIFALVKLRKLLPASRSPSIFIEWHNPEPQRYGQGWFFKDVDGVVSITHRLKNFLIDTYDLDSQSILVAPDGVDLSRYAGIHPQEARETIGIPADVRVVMYTGHLYDGKGASVLAECAADIDAEVYIVGGTSKDVETLRERYGHRENLTFTGFIAPAEIPLYQRAADVLIAPYTPDARQYLSPLKLFEYMAAGKPIVASDLPVLREVLTHEENALLVEPGSSEDLGAAIRRVLNDEFLANALAENARNDVAQYSWTRRAEAILAFIEERR